MDLKGDKDLEGPRYCKHYLCSSILHFFLANSKFRRSKFVSYISFLFSFCSNLKVVLNIPLYSKARDNVQGRLID